MPTSKPNSKNIMSVILIILLFACVSTNGVLLHDRRREVYHDATSSLRISRGDSSQQEDVNIHDQTEMSTSSRREPFQRVLVLCKHDNECERKSFCHGGEGHKSCLPCRRSRRRCQRNGMCCHGNVCRQGRCVPKEMRYDTSYAKTSSSDPEEESISQHTRDNMRKLREDEACQVSDQCGDGLCCAQHFWTRICKPILVEGDVCTKKRDRNTDFFQRCHCGSSLSCKRHPAPNIRYHTCQFLKGGKRNAIGDKDDEIPVSLVKSEEDPTLHLEVQLTGVEVQHLWNRDNHNETRMQETVSDSIVHSTSAKRFVPEKHWNYGEDGEDEKQNIRNISRPQSNSRSLQSDGDPESVTQFVTTL